MEKIDSPSSIFPHGGVHWSRVRGVSVDVEVVSQLRDHRTKHLGHFMGLGVKKRAGRKG